MKDTNVQVRISEKLLNQFKALAAEQETTMSLMIRQLMLKAIKDSIHG